MDIIKKPIITEKVSSDNELFNRYGFIVRLNANKIEVKKEVEEMYGVTVLKVRTMIAPAKRKVKNTKKGPVVGKVGRYKKALVDLAEGESIDLYNNI
ncbi:MAG: 50S ribosomal protein L23 [Flavobacteriaceae bacterium]|nr:50S ribosomal protein L23 [Flavobacteriaceae bacterium]